MIGHFVEVYRKIGMKANADTLNGNVELWRIITMGVQYGKDAVGSCCII